MELVVLLACPAMQELSAPGADTDLGVAPEPYQLLLVETATATPAGGDRDGLGLNRGAHPLIIRSVRRTALATGIHAVEYAASWIVTVARVWVAGWSIVAPPGPIRTP